jgi:hypothetical protein
MVFIIVLAIQLGFSISSFAAPANQLHLVSIYESYQGKSSQKHPIGFVNLTLTGTGRTTLALSSYEPTHWIIKVSPGVTVDRVYLNGYHFQFVSGVSPHKVEKTVFLTNGRFLQPFASNKTNAVKLAHQFEDLTHIPFTTSIQSRRSGQVFTINIQPRKTDMGFTLFPFKNPAQMSSNTDILSMVNQTRDFVKQRSDVVFLHYDDAVPWEKALLCDPEKHIKMGDISCLPKSLQDEWRMQKALFGKGEPFANKKIFLGINAININRDGLASCWTEDSQHASLSHSDCAHFAQLDFKSPFVYAAYYNFVMLAYEFFKPQYLAIGQEANILASRVIQQYGTVDKIQDSNIWEEYIAFNKKIYWTLKLQGLKIPIFNTLQYENLIGLMLPSEMRDESRISWLVRQGTRLMVDSDYVGLSVYPTSVCQVKVESTYFVTAQKIAKALNKKIAIEETGFFSKSIGPFITDHRDYSEFYSSGQCGQVSETDQKNYLETLFRFAHSHEVPLLINYLPIDYQFEFGTDTLSLTFGFTGLAYYTESIQKKPSNDVWDYFYKQGGARSSYFRSIWSY